MDKKISLNMNQIQEGIEHFYIPRQEGDIDLVALVRYALEQQGLHERVANGFNNHPVIIDASDKQPSVQRWLLNHYWFLQLIDSEVDTMSVRSYLIHNGTEEDWMKLFVQYILPFVVKNDLPKPFTKTSSEEMHGHQQ
ncbi:MAG TPA: hypothetical protein VN843_22550 [Anaerolineales bacterium]|nr:hypothetical protein [Anaerolineales bacterium]